MGATGRALTVAKTARFQVRSDAVDEAIVAITTFVDEIARSEPDTLFYTAFQAADDPARFTHFFAFRDEAAEEAHRGTPWVKAFTDVLYPLTVDGVSFDDHRLVAVTGGA